MKINFKELIFKIKLADDKGYPDLLAYASLKLLDDHERHLTYNGFTIRKSQFNGKPYLMPPSKRTGKGFFKFLLAEKSLWKEIEKVAVEQYEFESIPIVEEK
jgi:hypothetical protein